VPVGIEVGTGTRLGNYVLSDQIGRGGMGVVYRATHVHLGREVALKILAPELTGSEDFRKRFLRESRLAASLDHPNAIAVYDAGEADGTLYIAMRYVPGSDLTKFLKENAPLESATALSMLDQVGAALDAAHELGLIHRDVKPANVLLASGNCYLTDFGITKQAGATEASALTKTGQFLGTIGYVAPEQIKGQEVDGRADIYALTCILYECLTGSRPFPKDSELAVISAHLLEPPPRPTESRPELPEAIDAVVAKGMAKSAADRYPTCSELMAAAREALGAAEARAPQSAARSATVSRDRAPPEVTVEASRGARGTRTVVASQSPDRRRRRRPVVAAVVLLSAAAIAVAVVLVASGGTAAHKGHTPTAAHTSTAAHAPTEGHTATAVAAVSPTAAHVVGAPIQVGSQPTGIDGNSSFLWVANFGASTVTRVTPDGKVRTDIQLQPAPFAVLRIGGTFWVSSADAGTVTPISVSTGLPGKPIAVGDKPEWMAGDDDGLWVTNATSDTVSTLDPDTGKLIGAPIKVGRVPRGIAYSGDAVWVADSEDDDVDRIANGRVTATIRVGREPIGVAFGANAVWVANKLDNTVSRIALPQDTTKTINVGKDPFSIVFGLGSAWVTNSGDDTVTRLDATTGDPVGSPIAVGQDPTGIAVIGQAVWVTNRRSDTVQKIVP